MKLTNTHPLSDFGRNGNAHAERLKATGEAELLTVDGRAELVIQSAAAYQKLLDAAERAEVLPSLRKSVAEADRGETRPVRDVLNELATQAGLGPIG